MGMEMGMDLGIFDFVSCFLMYKYCPPSFGELSPGLEAKCGFEIGTFRTSLNWLESDGSCGWYKSSKKGAHNLLNPRGLA